MDTEPKIGYYHFRIMSYKYNPAVTVAYRRKDSFSFELGFSFSDPDDQFCRRNGRERACKRLEKIPVRMKLDPTNITFGYSEQRFLIEKFMLHLFHFVPDYPVYVPWFRDFTDSYFVERAMEWTDKMWDLANTQFGRKNYEPNTIKLRNPMDYLI